MILDKSFLPLTVLAALGCGLMAGLFFTFSTFVMKALSRLPPGEGMAAMQAINSAILNPLFFTLFFGTVAVCLWAVVASLMRWHHDGSAYRLAGGALYLVGGFLVTVVFNVPMNEKLAATPSASPEAAALWSSYLTNWTAWNHVRTVASLAAAALLTLSLV
ncbi:hypothetical protein D187_004349 [Cystobacter fuscus DSM 2262]|uniref:DUF1772 domain-containing protein n=1 Tax=Cystobacter fuscus (strain ATCC 25194 / DSM 2262 / NBRC 100088 / M29) TaxID=1242864 RepID=S9P0U3_CYSF2|nr:anthrone oxygenase family protein [Cystobacter fuscus]EPX58060.1 hypothetical protein D187_004349 [Cystobacter fuscus DSM 2262]